MRGGSAATTRRPPLYGGALAFGALAALLMQPANAEGEAPFHCESFSGFEASDNYAIGYVGGGYAFGKALHAPGWRMRGVGA